MKNNHSRPQIDSLTGLRFFAAISIALAHGSVLLLTFDQNFKFAQWLQCVSGIGMPLFFVLSGFVIHYNYSSLVTEKSISNKLKFMWARFSRVYPLFLLVLLLDILTNRNFLAAWADSVESAIKSIQALPYYLVLVQSWFFKVIGQNNLIYQLGPNTPLMWSISTEWFFYLAFLVLAAPLSYLCRHQKPLRVTFILIGWIACFWALSYSVSEQVTAINRWGSHTYGSIASVEHGYQDSFVRWVKYFSPYSRLGEFITGCLVSALYLSAVGKSISHKEAKIGHLLTWLSLIAVFVSFYLAYTNPPVTNLFTKVRDNIGLAPALAALIFCTARYKSPIAKFLSCRSIVLLGEASYSIYVVHILVFMSIRQLSSYVSLPASSMGVMMGIARYLLALGIVLVISIGSYSLIERPAKKWLRAFWKKDAKIQWRVLGFLLAPCLLSCAFFCMDAYINRPADPDIIITSATYGANCGAPEGNATEHIQHKCRRGSVCTYVIHVNFLGDPAPKCPKNFVVEYRCKDGSIAPPIVVTGEAGLGKRITLSCPR